MTDLTEGYLGQWQHLTVPIGRVIDALAVIFDQVRQVRRHGDLDVHRILNACVEEFGLSPSRERKSAILAKVMPHLEPCLDRCESPIEAIMLFAMLSTFAVCCTGDWSSVDDGIVLRSKPGSDSGIVLWQQVTVGRYRPDFLLDNGTARNIVIECDGHHFHERTAAQAQRDRSRDRQFQIGGYLVLRFTGSEIHRRPSQCAAEVFDAAFPGHFSP